MLKDDFYVIKISNFYVSEIERRFNVICSEIISIKLTKDLADAKKFLNYSAVVEIVKEIRYGDIYVLRNYEILTCKYEDLDSEWDNE